MMKTYSILLVFLSQTWMINACNDFEEESSCDTSCVKTHADCRSAEDDTSDLNPPSQGVGDPEPISEDTLDTADNPDAATDITMDQDSSSGEESDAASMRRLRAYYPARPESDAGCGLEEDTDPCAETDPSTGSEFIFTVPPDEEEPNMLETPVSLYIPGGVNAIRAILVFSDHALGADEYMSATWRDSAKQVGYALMKVHLQADDDDVIAYNFPGQAAHMLVRIFEKSAEESSRPELAYCPFFHFGHSAGGFFGTAMASYLTDRALGFIGFHGAVQRRMLDGTDANYDKILSEPFLSVPGLILIGDYDHDGIKDSSIALCEAGRQLGAKWFMVILKDSNHFGTAGMYDTMIPFVEELMRLRLPEVSDEPYKELPALVPLNESDGWIGRLEHHRETEEGADRGLEIVDNVELFAPGTYEGSSEDTHWLFSESFAELWKNYHLQ